MKKKFVFSLTLIILVMIVSILYIIKSGSTPVQPPVSTLDVQVDKNGDAGKGILNDAWGQNKNQEQSAPLAVNKSVPISTNLPSDTQKTGGSVAAAREENQKEADSAVTSNAQAVSRSEVPASSSKYPERSKNLGIYGQFRYREASGGRIEIDPQWVAENIVTITLPGLNQQVEVNKAAKDKFIKAFTIIKNGTVIINGQKVPLLSLVKSMDGTFVSRHVNWNTANGLSNHSWGIAIDINADDHFGSVDAAGEPNDPNVILWEKAFKPAGFSWGNSYGDSMHFELLG